MFVGFMKRGIAIEGRQHRDYVKTELYPRELYM